VEVASSTQAYDLHEKRRDYERYGVAEYLVLLLRESRAVWYARKGLVAPFTELPQDGDHVIRSNVFPGLWLDAAALMRGDLKRVLEVLNMGLASPAHAAFISTHPT
jgi:Uma2 family endonuclease